LLEACATSIVWGAINSYPRKLRRQVVMSESAFKCFRSIEVGFTTDTSRPIKIGATGQSPMDKAIQFYSEGSGGLIKAHVIP